MIRALLATAAVALGGSTLLVPPASGWLLWLGLTAVGLVGFVGVQIALDWYGERRDARRRNRSLRWR